MENKTASFRANADFLGPGAIEVNKYENEIFDIVRRVSPTLNRLPTMKSTGHPHRYFEQTAISQGAFNDPRNINPNPSNPTRVERTAYIKCISNQTNISMFDKAVTQQQAQFDFVVGKDISDIINGIELVRAAALWTGNDTSMSAPTTQQYMGFLNQITLTATIVPGASIIDGLKAQIASMAANQTYVVRPQAIYVNPIIGDYIDREAKAANITFGTLEVVGGVKVKTLSTQVGELPIITDPFLPIVASGTAYGFPAPPANNQNYFCAILTDRDCEVPYVSGEQDNPLPLLFQLGLVGNLAGQFVAVKFDAVVAKGASYNHAIVCIQRP